VVASTCRRAGAPAKASSNGGQGSALAGVPGAVLFCRPRWPVLTRPDRRTSAPAAEMDLKADAARRCGPVASSRPASTWAARGLTWWPASDQDARQRPAAASGGRSVKQTAASTRSGGRSAEGQASLPGLLKDRRQGRDPAPKPCSTRALVWQFPRPMWRGLRLGPRLKGYNSGAVAVAQLVESRIVIPVVVGSSPISHPSLSLTAHRRARYGNDSGLFFSQDGAPLCGTATTDLQHYYGGDINAMAGHSSTKVQPDLACWRAIGSVLTRATCLVLRWPTQTLLALADLRWVPPCQPGKIVGLWNDFRAAAGEKTVGRSPPVRFTL